MDNNNSLSLSSNPTSQGYYNSLSPHPSTMIMPNLSAMNIPNQTAYTTSSQTTAVPNPTATNTNTNYIPDFSPAALSALTFNRNLPSIPPTLQDIPMPMAISNHSNMTPFPYTTSDYPPTNNGQPLVNDFSTQWQGNHINRPGHNNNLTTYDGPNAPFPLDLSLIANSGITWPNMPQLTQGQYPTAANGNGYQAFDINCLPLSSLPVDHHQHQQQDMSCLLNPPGFGTHDTNGRQSNETLVAPYASGALGPSSLFLQQQQQQQQQTTPILASQRTPDLTSQQLLLPPHLQQQLYYPPTMNVNNSSNSNNNSTHPFDSTSSSSSAIAQHNLHHQRHSHQQQQSHKPPEMHHYYEAVHTRLQEQERQRQQHEQDQLHLQLQRLGSQMVRSQGDIATSTPTSTVPVPSSQDASYSSAYVPLPPPPPNRVSAYDPHSWKLNPNAALTAPASSGSPSSPVTDLSSRPSSAGVSTPQANIVPGSNHPQQISTGGGDISDESIPLVEQRLLTAAMDVKDFQSQFQELKQTLTYNQTLTLNQQLFQEQLDDLLMEQAQALARSHPQAPAQVQAQAQTQAQAQVQAHVASSQDCSENGNSLMGESDVGTRLTLYPGAIHQEQLRNYRGNRHYSYDQNGTPQTVLKNQRGNDFLESSSSSLASLSSTQQQQPAVGHQQQSAVGQKQLAVGFPFPQVGSSHSSLSISSETQQTLTQAQMHIPFLQVNASHGSPSDGPDIGNSSATQIQALPLQMDASHGSLEIGTATGTFIPQSSLAAQAYIQLPFTIATSASASASAASSIVGTPTEFNNLQSSSNLSTGNNSSSEQQQLSNNGNNGNGTLNIVGTNNNHRPTHFPPPFLQNQDIYYSFSFEPVECFARQLSWPSLVSGVPLNATGTADRAANQEVKEFLDSVAGDIKHETAQLDLYGGMSIPDAFLSSKVYPRLDLTTGISGAGDGGSGSVIDPKLQQGDDVVVVVKREKKPMLDVDFKAAATTTANSDEGNGVDRESTVIPITVRRAAAVAARAAAIAARESTINDYINLNVDIQGGNKNGHGHNRRSRDNVVAGQGNNSNISDSSEQPHDRRHHESATDVNDAIDEEYIPLPPPSPTLPPPTRPVPTTTTPPPPAPRQNARSRIPKTGGAIQNTSSLTPEPTVFKCEIPHCEKEFSTYGLLKSHKVSHDPEKPHWCDICSEDGITPRLADPTPLFPGMPIPIPEVKKYKRHHDLLRHKREQHPPLAVKIQRFQEKLEAKEARRVKAEEVRKVKAALRRAEKAAAQVANPTAASRRRRTSSTVATTITAASRRRTLSATITTATAAPRDRRAFSTITAISAAETTPVVTEPAGSEAPKTPRKRKLTETKRSTTNDDDEDEAVNDNDNDSDYQENTKKRRRSRTSSMSRTTFAIPRRRRSSARQTQPQLLHQENDLANSASSSSAVANPVNAIQIHCPGKNQPHQ
ncbi:hypothetical protein EC957_006307 [Mortierella hygrophila]|uniref:C2H2-type domain-containing protein n=1 Tax=Mortierella hygrophila TaxID=979708 RepID=A0A9P6FDW9_9FUNG|nr:hypothetical protein EC957_006307 [Mortierella hygrophila]